MIVNAYLHEHLPVLLDGLVCSFGLLLLLGLDGVVEVGNVKLVVLGVVDGHDLLGDGGLEGIVGVRKLGESVLGHFGRVVYVLMDTI